MRLHLTSFSSSSQLQPQQVAVHADFATSECLSSTDRATIKVLETALQRKCTPQLFEISLLSPLICGICPTGYQQLF